MNPITMQERPINAAVRSTHPKSSDRVKVTKFGISTLQYHLEQLTIILCFDFMDSSESQLKKQRTIEVGIRVRPFLNSQSAISQPCLDLLGDRIRVYDPQQFGEYYQNCFSDIFWEANEQECVDELSMESLQMRQNVVFERFCEPMVKNCINGSNCSILAYGKVGSGKTYTIFGDSKKRSGLVSRFANSLFSSQSNSVKINAIFSIFQLYHEKIYDLLAIESFQSYLRMRETPKGLNIENLTSLEIASSKDLQQLLQSALNKQKKHNVKMGVCNKWANVIIESQIQIIDERTKTVKKSKVTFGDLADCSIEGNNPRINSSIQCLNLIIGALASQQQFIPYRNSSLTRILKDSLSGNCFTCVIGTIAPELNSLRSNVMTLRVMKSLTAIKINPQQMIFPIMEQQEQNVELQSFSSKIKQDVKKQ